MNSQQPDHVRACQWASGIGEGEHADMLGWGYATCCDVGLISGQVGIPIAEMTPEAREGRLLELVASLTADFQRVIGWNELPSGVRS